jgi:predicted GIY-YIG superfamily endonuclease
MQWYTYILKCSDGSFYVGHTENIPNRVQAHNAGQGAVYTKYRRPVVLLYTEDYPSKAAAAEREQRIKRWSRAKKIALIEGDPDRLRSLAKRRK